MQEFTTEGIVYDADGRSNWVCTAGYASRSVMLQKSLGRAICGRPAVVRSVPGDITFEGLCADHLREYMERRAGVNNHVAEATARVEKAERELKAAREELKKVRP